MYEGLHDDKQVICLAREEKRNTRGGSDGHHFVFRHIRFSILEIFSKVRSVSLKNAHNVKNAFLYDWTLLSPLLYSSRSQLWTPVLSPQCFSFFVNHGVTESNSNFNSWFWRIWLDDLGYTNYQLLNGRGKCNIWRSIWQMGALYAFMKMKFTPHRGVIHRDFRL